MCPYAENEVSKGVTVELHPGKAVCLLEGNRVVKSTLLKAIAGISNVAIVETTPGEYPLKTESC